MFIAGAVSPAALDARMRRSLAHSLAHVHDVAGLRLGVSRAQIADALDHIETHRIEPGVFGLYFKLVPAIQADDIVAARALIQSIVERASQSPAFAVTPLSDEALGANRRLYCELIEAGSDGIGWLGTPAAGAWDGFDRKVDRALAIIAAADPALAQELRGLVVRVVGAASAGDRTFGGASSLMLWGLLVLNVETYGNVSLLAEGLVHEAAHLVLFAHSVDEPLVKNPLADRFASPLRRDARPMDGVFHATFVTARLYRFYRRLQETLADGVHGVPQALIESKIPTYRARYDDGVATIQRHGLLTDTGRQILAETDAYMKAA